MSGPEILYRLNQQQRKIIDRYFIQFAAPGMNINESNINFIIPKINVEQLPFDTRSFIDNVKNDAEKIMGHLFDVFGIERNFGNEINFHFDPKTEKSWPLQFWNSINYRDGQSIGGIKFAWEINRLHHLPRLGIAYNITGDCRYLEEIENEIAHWLRTNPYPYGINWISGIELGIRIVNIYFCLVFIPDEKITTSLKQNLITFINLHGHHLYRYPSKYSSCANHALAEALGLFVAGILAPELKQSKKWKSFGKHVLDREVAIQIYPDGSSFEHSIPYLQFVADHFLIYYWLCKQHNEKIHPNIKTRLSTICNFIASIVDSNGNIPFIGDDDSGYLVKMWFSGHNNYFSILNTCAILFNEGAWIHPNAELDEKTIFLIGDNVKSKWTQLKKQNLWQYKSVFHQNAGISVIKHHKNDREILFIGNSGPLGLKPLGGHGHADGLSFWLSVNGQPFFIDPGTYLYHSGGKWRRFFRSTAAHNTISIDDKDQSEQISDFMFDDFYEIHDIKWHDTEDQVEWGAEHDGYSRLSDPVIHRRDVTFKKSMSIFEFKDSLKCKGQHQASFVWHLHPEINVEVKKKNHYLLSYYDTHILFVVHTDQSGHLYSGSEHPVAGWYSERFNAIEKTNTIIFNVVINGSSLIKTTVKIL